jgi:hypothetical protein
MHKWTDTIDKTLEIMRQNTLKLSELSRNQYNAFKQRIDYINMPLAILSGANAVAIFILDNYVNEHYVTIACGVTSATVAGLLSSNWFLGTSRKMEEHFSFHHKCESISNQIKSILQVSREERKIDGSAFLMDKFAEYKELIANHPLIEQFQGNFTVEKDSICEEVEDMQAYLYDHWNIIFRPTLRRFKQKNKKVLESLRQTGVDIQSVVEPVVEQVVEQVVEKKADSFLSWIWKTTSAKQSDEVDFSIKQIEEKADEHDDFQDSPEYLEMSDIYQNDKKSSIPYKDIIQSNSKKFGMNFFDKK